MFLSFLGKHRLNIFWLILFIYIFALCSIFPMNRQHDFEYNIAGNPFLLQWDEYFRWHGRFFTHTLARIFFQHGNFIYFFGKSLIIFLLFYFSFRTIINSDSQTEKSENLFTILLIFSIFFLLITVFPITKFLMYYSTDTIYLYSYYIFASLALIYLGTYMSLFKESYTVNIPLLYLTAFLTGTSFEIAIACIPLIILIYILLKTQKKEIPSWFWRTLPFFFIGFSFLMLSPGSNKRLDFYANASEWEYFGQTVNWFDLGYKKYFYGFMHHVFYQSPKWFSSPGFIPSTWHIQIIILLFTFFNFQKVKNIFAPKVLFPIFWFIFAWLTCLVSIPSPMYHTAMLELGKFFFYISLSISIYHFLTDYSHKTKIIFISIFFGITFLGQIIQIPAIYQARQEYLRLVQKIEDGEISSLTMDQLPTAKLGNFTIIQFGSGLPIKYPKLFSK